MNGVNYLGSTLFLKTMPTMNGMNPVLTMKWWNEAAYQQGIRAAGNVKKNVTAAEDHVYIEGRRVPLALRFMPKAAVSNQARAQSWSVNIPRVHHLVTWKENGLATKEFPGSSTDLGKLVEGRKFSDTFVKADATAYTSKNANELFMLAEMEIQQAIMWTFLPAANFHTMAPEQLSRHISTVTGTVTKFTESSRAEWKARGANMVREYIQGRVASLATLTLPVPMQEAFAWYRDVYARIATSVAATASPPRWPVTFMLNQTMTSIPTNVITTTVSGSIVPVEELDWCVGYTMDLMGRYPKEQPGQLVTLGAFLRRKGVPRADMIAVVWQCLCLLGGVHATTGMYHNDCHLGNFMVRIAPESSERMWHLPASTFRDDTREFVHVPAPIDVLKQRFLKMWNERMYTGYVALQDARKKSRTLDPFQRVRMMDTDGETRLYMRTRCHVHLIDFGWMGTIPAAEAELGPIPQADTFPQNRHANDYLTFMEQVMRTTFGSTFAAEWLVSARAALPATLQPASYMARFVHAALKLTWLTIATPARFSVWARETVNVSQRMFGGSAGDEMRTLWNSISSKVTSSIALVSGGSDVGGGGGVSLESHPAGVDSESEDELTLDTAKELYDTYLKTSPAERTSEQIAAAYRASLVLDEQQGSDVIQGMKLRSGKVLLRVAQKARDHHTVFRSVVDMVPPKPEHDEIPDILNSLQPETELEKEVAPKKKKVVKRVSFLLPEKEEPRFEKAKPETPTSEEPDSRLQHVHVHVDGEVRERFVRATIGCWVSMGMHVDEAGDMVHGTVPTSIEVMRQRLLEGLNDIELKTPNGVVEGVEAHSFSRSRRSELTSR
jgi:hypothetical protein